VTTTPPEPAPGPGTEPHRERAVAEAFGADAERYERARPSYPQAMVERIVAAMPGRDLIDAGCGTGISSRLFQLAGCQVLGVEPDTRMADLARRGGTAVEIAKFEDWDPAGRAFDAVVAGQAWHWVDPVAGAAKAAQALRPGGRLALFWNAFQPPPAVAAAFADVSGRVLPGSPLNLWARPIVEMYLTMCGTAADGIRAAGGFGEPETWRFDWARPYTRDEWLDQVPTFGGWSRMPAAAQHGLLAGMGDAIDAVGGTFTMGYATVVATAARTA
jgi:SAM-dependent methyltransferase